MSNYNNQKKSEKSITKMRKLFCVFMGCVFIFIAVLKRNWYVLPRNFFFKNFSILFNNLKSYVLKYFVEPILGSEGFWIVNKILFEVSPYNLIYHIENYALYDSKTEERVFSRFFRKSFVLDVKNTRGNPFELVDILEELHNDTLTPEGVDEKYVSGIVYYVKRFLGLKNESVYFMLDKSYIEKRVDSLKEKGFYVTALQYQTYSSYLNKEVFNDSLNARYGSFALDIEDEYRFFFKWVIYKPIFNEELAKKYVSDVMGKRRHLFHLVDPSPWPLLASISALMLTVGGVMYMHFYKNGFFLMSYGLVLLLMVMFVWWRDVIREATFEGKHTSVVQRGLKMGMLLFILSEVMFFFAFFWAFFHSSLAPTLEIGSVWPPAGIKPFNPWEIPLLNTMLLLLSGASITWSHHGLLSGSRFEAKNGLIVTIILALIFTGFQYFEYVSAPFSISDGIYGSTFYMTTGFHGFHVIVGTIFLVVCLVRLLRNHFTQEHHVGFESAIWYWHFVDVVWLFLFVTIYWWGSLL